MSQALEESNTRMIETEIKSELKVLEKQYPKMRRVEVLQAYGANPEIPLEELARVSHDEVAAIEHQAVQSYVKEKTTKKPSPFMGGGTPPARPPRTFKTIEEATEAAAEHIARMQED